MSAYRTFMQLAALAGLLALPACRHRISSDRSLGDFEYKGWQKPHPTGAALDAAVVIDRAEKLFDREIRVSGRLADVQYSELSKGVAKLVMRVQSARPGADADAVSARPPSVLALAGRLESVSDRLMGAAGHLDIQVVGGDEWRTVSYDLKSAGRRVRALSHYFKATDLTPVADNVAEIAAGYSKIADGYGALAQAPASAGGNTGVEVKAPPIPELDLKQAAEPGSFEGLLRQAADDLLLVASQLIAHRRQLIDGRLRFDTADFKSNSGYTIMSTGDLFGSRFWEAKRDGNESRAAAYKVVSEAFLDFGDGLTQIQRGFTHAGDELDQLSAPPVVAANRDYGLKCAFVGFNREVMRDATAKLKQAPPDLPIVVRGHLLHGNFREEVNQVWLAMQTVSIDGLTIDLSYGNDSMTRRNMREMSQWVRELD